MTESQRNILNSLKSLHIVGWASVWHVLPDFKRILALLGGGTGFDAAKIQSYLLNFLEE